MIYFSNVFLGLLSQINGDNYVYLDEGKQCTLFDKVIENDFHVIRTNNLSSVNDVWGNFYKVINQGVNIIDSILNGKLSQDYMDKLTKKVLPTTKKYRISSKFTTKKRKEPTFKIFSERNCSTYHVFKNSGRFNQQLHIDSTSHPVLANNISNNIMAKNVKRFARNATLIYPTSRIVREYKPYLKTAVKNDNSTHIVNVKYDNIILNIMAKNSNSDYPILVNNNTVLKIIAKNDSSNNFTTSVYNIITKTIARKDNDSALLDVHVYNNISNKDARNTNFTHTNMVNNSINVTRYFNQTITSIVSTKVNIQTQTEQNVKILKLSKAVKPSENVVEDSYVAVMYVILLIAISKYNFYYYYFCKTFNDLYYFRFNLLSCIKYQY